MSKPGSRLDPRTTPRGAWSRTLEGLGFRRRAPLPTATGGSLVSGLWRRGAARVAIAVLVGLLAFLLLTPLLSSQNVYAQSSAQLQAPSARHLLGTDQHGSDLLVRLAAGGRRSLTGAVLALSISVATGVAVGVAAAVSGRVVDGVLMRAVDALNGLPPLVIPIALVGALGPGYGNLLTSIVIGYVPSYARVARTFAETLRDRPDIVSAQVMGIRRRRIAATHVLPAVLTQMVVIATLDVGSVIVALSSLSFLGLGAQAPTPEWGVLLGDGQTFFAVAPWLLIAPAAAVTALVISCNMLGESLRAAVSEQEGR